MSKSTTVLLLITLCAISNALIPKSNFGGHSERHRDHASRNEIERIDASSAMPGALSAYMNVSSVSNFMAFVFPLGAYYLQNVTVPINYKTHSWWYGLEIGNMTITNAAVMAPPSPGIEFDASTDNLNAHLTKMSLSADIDVTFWLFRLIPFTNAHFDLKNANITCKVGFTSDDQVNW
jgi:hypothetical protein